MDGLTTPKSSETAVFGDKNRAFITLHNTPKFAVFAVFGEFPRRNPPPPIYRGAEVETFFRGTLQ